MAALRTVAPGSASLALAAVPKGAVLLRHAFLGLLPAGLQAGARRNAWAGMSEVRASGRARREADAALAALEAATLRLDRGSRAAR